MPSTSNTATSAASSRPASTQMPAFWADEPVRRSARLRKRDPATRAVATLSAAGLEATTPSSPAAGEQPIEIVAAEQLVALRATPRPLEPLFLGNDATEEEEERLEAMEVEDCFPSAFADVLSAGGKGRTPRACVHCHLGGHKKCVQTERALPTMVYAGDAPPNHLHRGERGVERAHVTGAGGRGLGEVRGLDRDSDGVADPNWAYAMRIIWSASPRGRRVPVLTTIEEYFDRQRRLRSMRSPFEDIEPPSVPGSSLAPESAE
ncbi:uncharacterized protein MEPE_05031 [Melanopsichium pennsylvanicum]|uniref:Uncharacterized protein n=1 Tax=Melanopsichium pennsylvanicum TaxID=63383 RepID=A0AAJ4XR18_9BASI|nr:uncharacterized protein MEPE_05031 [Melanopsichium pennsylvanicum]